MNQLAKIPESDKALEYISGRKIQYNEIEAIIRNKTSSLEKLLQHKSKLRYIKKLSHDQMRTQAIQTLGLGYTYFEHFNNNNVIFLIIALTGLSMGTCDAIRNYSLKYFINTLLEEVESEILHKSR